MHDQIAVSEQITQPLPQPNGACFQAFLERYTLSICDVAQAAGVRLFVVWKILHGEPVSAEQANRVRIGLLLLTLEGYRGNIAIRKTVQQIHTTPHRPTMATGILQKEDRSWR